MELTPRMYAEVWMAMARYDIKIKDMAKEMDLTPKTLFNKLHGVTDWKLSECEKIAELLHDTMENLFPRK